MSYPIYSSAGTKDDAINVASVAPTYPGTITAGDLLFILAVIEDSTGDVQIPTGYSTVGAEYAQTAITTNVSAYLFYKVAIGSETGTETVSGGTLSGGTADYLFAQIYRITGTNATLHDTDSLKGTSATITWDTTTIGKITNTLLAFVVNWDAGAAPDTPSGYTIKKTDTSTAISGTYVYLSALEGAVSGASATAANGSANGWATFHASLYDDITIRTFIVN